MNRLGITVFIIAFITNVFSEESLISGKITSLSLKEELYKEGEVFRAKLLIWPFADRYRHYQNDFNELILDENIKLLTVDKIQFSENNPDLLEVLGVFVLLKKPVMGSLTWKNKDLVIEFKIDKLQFVEIQGRITEPSFLEQ